MSTDLAPLIARVEAATGPDREIDLALACIAFNKPEEYFLTDELERRAFGCQQRYTASLDAALALVERVLPGKMLALAGPWRWADHTEHAGRPIWCAELADCTEVSGFGYTEINDLEHRGCTPALALLLALLRALQAQSAS